MNTFANYIPNKSVMYPDKNLGIVVLEKQASVWGVGGGYCEPPVGLGQSTGGGLGSSAVFLIQNTSFILNLIVSVTLIIQYL